MNVVSDTRERLQAALSMRNMKAVDLSEKTGIPKASISHYLAGRVEPKQNRIYAMAQALNVAPAWLIGYDVPMEDHNATVLSLLDQMTEVQKKQVVSYMRFLLEEGGTK